MCNEQNQNTASLISLLDIARWQVSGLENYLSTSSEAINTDLPALQRGAVWKTKQTEQLWDSILRGFPIGSFILSKAEKEAIEDIGKGNFKLKMIDTNTGSSEPTHFLLDGQQRATAIALGFYDIWSDKKVEDAPLALWLDLSPNESKEAVAHNKYLFRVTTRAHIWGYQANDPSKRLSANAMRNALSAFDARNNEKRHQQKFSYMKLGHGMPLLPCHSRSLLKQCFRISNNLKMLSKNCLKTCPSCKLALRIKK